MPAKYFTPVQISKNSTQRNGKNGCVMTVTDKRLGFGYGVLEKMEYPPYAGFFFDAEHNRLAVKPFQERKEGFSIRFSKDKEKQTSYAYVSNPALLDLVHKSIPGQSKNVRILGKYDGRMKGFIFDLKKIS